MTGTSRSRWMRAQSAEREYQARKAEAVRGDEAAMLADHAMHARAVRDRLAPFVEIGPSTRILEVGCGPHGVSFFLGDGEIVAVDPLADYYDRAFAWVRSGAKVKTVAATGESLPFEAASFDLVISDNVLDHTMDPDAVLAEIARVSKEGAVFYFTVNVHAWTGHALSRVYEAMLSRFVSLGAFEPHPFAFRERDVAPMLRGHGFRLVATTSEALGGVPVDAPAHVRVRRRLVDLAFPVHLVEAISVHGER